MLLITYKRPPVDHAAEPETRERVNAWGEVETIEAMAETMEAVAGGPVETGSARYAAGPFHSSDEVDDALRQLADEGAVELRSWQISPDDFAPDGHPTEPPDGDRVSFDRDRHYGVPGVRVRFPYNHDVINTMKEQIPSGHREYRGDDRSWWVSARYAPTLRQILADEWGIDFESSQHTEEVARAIRVLARYGIEATGSGSLLVLRPAAVAEIDAMIRRNGRTRW